MTAQTYRLFRLHASHEGAEPALWADLGTADLDLSDDPAAAVGAAYGAGEYLVIDASLTVVDFTVTA